MKSYVLVTGYQVYCVPWTIYCYGNMPALFCSAAIFSHLVSSHLCHYLFPVGFLTKTIHTFFFFPAHITLPANFILLYLILPLPKCHF
jgi:hypothetical protein